VTLPRSRVRVILVLVALAAATLVVIKLATAGDSAIANRDPHADPHLPAAQQQRLLAATDAASSSTSKAELVSKGRALFNDSSVARSGEACGGCHTFGTTNAGQGTIPHTDAGGKVLFARDPPTLVGAAKTAPYGWTGNTPTLKQMVLNTITGHFKDGAANAKNHPDVVADQAAALVAYVSSIRAPTTSFDQGTMSPAAMRGETLFQGKAACIGCHGGPLFTDNGMHNTFVPNRDGWDDPGATAPAHSFNTPTLRDVRNSAPYMHNGVFKDLRDVIGFYNARSSIAPLNLSPQEVDDLVAYMEAL
jgi:cytochrome c peroxidase